MKKLLLSAIAISLLAISAFASGPGIFMMAAKKTSSSVPGIVTFGSLTNSPAQLTASFTAGSPAPSTYNLYYADNAVASIIPANFDCTYLLLTGYNVSSTTYPGSPNATAGKYTGITSSPFTINGPLTGGTTYCARVTGVSAGSVEGLGSTPLSAAAAVLNYNVSTFESGVDGWTKGSSGGSVNDSSSIAMNPHTGNYSYDLQGGFTDPDYYIGWIEKTITMRNGTISIWAFGIDSISTIAVTVTGGTVSPSSPVTVGYNVYTKYDFIVSGITDGTSHTVRITNNWPDANEVYLDDISIPVP